MRRVFLFAAAVSAGSTPAAAHAFAQRYDLPLPLWHYLAGAGGAVALSFVVVALAGRGPPARPSALLVPLAPGFVRVVAAAGRAFGLAALLLLVAVGFAGPQGDWDSNLLPVTVWVLWWVGLTFLCALIGDVWRLLDPWRTLARLLFAPRWRGLVRLPSRLARRLDAWPAVVLLLVFGWAELVWPDNAVPRKLAAAVVLYTLVSLTIMAAFGRTSWRRRCDPFARFFALIASAAPVATGRAGGRPALVVRLPGAGLVGRDPVSPAAAAFVIVTLALVSFDGVAETPFWDGVVGRAVGILYATGVVGAVGYRAADALVETIGLLVAPIAFAALYLVAAAATARIVGEPAGRVAHRFVPTLVPIAVGYHIAHYQSYLLIQGQAALPLLSDPFGLGWDLFGTRNREVDIGVVGMRWIWDSAVGAVVAGHVVAIVLADRVARQTYAARAAAGQIPMAVLMIDYTMLSLWILSQPIVN